MSDSLGLRTMSEYQAKIECRANVLHNKIFKSEHIQRIEEWFNSIPTSKWKNRLAQKMRSLTKTIHHRNPSELLSHLWELYVAYELISRDCTIHDLARDKAKKSPDYLVSKDGVDFVVECKLSYGQQEKISYRRNRIGPFLEVKGDELENFLAPWIEAASQQTCSVKQPAVLAFCDVNSLVHKGVAPHELPSKFSGNLLPNRNLTAVWYCTNHFIWWPWNTISKSYILFNGEQIDPEFQNCLLDLNFGQKTEIPY